MRFIALAMLLSGCTTVMCPGGPAYPIEKSECAFHMRHAMRSARIAKIEHGREEVPFVVVHLEFMNAFEADQSLTSYTANWSGGTKHVNGLDLTVPRGSMIQRTLRIDPSDGDLQRIDETATVQW